MKLGTTSDSARVLVLNQHYWPEIAATAQILSDVCEDLTRYGHRVSVICGQPSYRSIGAHEHRLPELDAHKGVEIRRVWSHTPAQRSIPQRLLHYGSYFGSSLATALSTSRADVCLVMSTPPLLLGLSGTVLRTLQRVPFVYCVQDLYPDVAVHLGVLPEKSPLTRGIEMASNLLYRAASSIITISPAMAAKLERKGVRSGRIEVIPNWADTGSISPQPRSNAFAREHGLDEGFVLQYSGNLGLSQGLHSLIEAAELVSDLPVRFALIGDGNAKEPLAEEVRRRRLTNVMFLPPQPRERLGELLSSCDVGLVTMKAEVSDDLVPSKLYGIMAAGKPVLAAAAAHSEVAKVLNAHQCGWVVDPENAKGLAECIRRIIATDAVTRREMGERGRRACLKHYSRHALTRRYEEVLLAAAGKSAAPGLFTPEDAATAR